MDMSVLLLVGLLLTAIKVGFSGCGAHLHSEKKFYVSKVIEKTTGTSESSVFLYSECVSQKRVVALSAGPLAFSTSKNAFAHVVKPSPDCKDLKVLVIVLQP